MDDTAFRFGVLNIGIGVLLILLSLPLWMKLIPMNPIYGLRFGRATRSVDDWYAVNHYGARQFIRCSMGILACGVIYLFVPFDSLYQPQTVYDNLFVAAAICPMFLCSTIALIRTGIYASKD